MDEAALEAIFRLTVSSSKIMPTSEILQGIFRHLGLPAAVAACVSLTWDTFTGLELIPRLVFTLILAVIAHEFLARYLAPSPPKTKVGFHPGHQDETRSSRLRVALSALVLAGAAVIFSGLAWLQTERFVISAERTELNGSQSLSLHASWIQADHIIVRLPPRPTECDVTEQGASLTEINWESATRRLRIDDFSWPQKVHIICSSNVPIGHREIAVEGAADGPYFFPELKQFRLTIILMGVATWLYGLFRLRRLS